ncbi:MAG: two-component system sensor histidine kinase/response regulator [Hyphomicrobiales bacterium]|nr:MAG: two-component system sensor histidine kinase/response regulator [Hyphomicrobiales bacterium]
MFQSNRGKALMDEANLFFLGIIRQADTRLTEGVAEQRENAGWLRVVSALGAVIIIVVVGGAAYGLWRYTRELRATRDEVTALNEELEQRVSDRTRDLVLARDRAQVLLSEVNHRVANSLALVSSLVNLQGKSIGDETAKKALAETQDRIFAISLVHKRLYGSNDVRVVTLDEYLAGLLDHLQSSLRSEAQGVRLTYELEPVVLATDASVNLGVVVTEWVTNAFKYAYPAGSGEIRVRLQRLDDAQIRLTVEDDGVGRADGEPARGTGLGTRIVTAMASSMKASIDYQQRQPGTQATLTFAEAPTP